MVATALPDRLSVLLFVGMWHGKSTEYDLQRRVSPGSHTYDLWRQVSLGSHIGVTIYKQDELGQPASGLSRVIMKD